jgi:hypothetical protein
MQLEEILIITVYLEVDKKNGIYPVYKVTLV